VTQPNKELRAEVERLTKERDDWKELALAISERRALEGKP
jgi:hypothetical protein